MLFHHNVHAKIECAVMTQNSWTRQVYSGTRHVVPLDHGAKWHRRAHLRQRQHDSREDYNYSADQYCQKTLLNRPLWIECVDWWMSTSSTVEHCWRLRFQKQTKFSNLITVMAQIYEARLPLNLKFDTCAYSKTIKLHKTLTLTLKIVLLELFDPKSH